MRKHLTEQDREDINLPALKEEFLPDTIEQLTEYVLVGHERLKAFRLKVRAIDKLKVAQEVRDQTVEDGQRVAEAVLWAEAKLGELLKAIKPNIESYGRGTIERHKSLPGGISKKQSYEAQQLANNPEEIREVIEEAKTEKEIPIKGDVLKKIKKKKPKKQIVNEENITSESFLQAYNNFYDVVLRAMQEGFKITSRIAILARLEILKNVVKK